MEPKIIIYIFLFQREFVMKKICFFSTLFLILPLILNSCSGIDERLAPVESIDILVLESFPVQIHLLVNGNLPTPCYEITQIEKHRERNIFYVKLMMKDSGLVCIKKFEPFQETIALDACGLSAGTYHVDVNGIGGTFTLDVGNILSDIAE